MTQANSGVFSHLCTSSGMHSVFEKRLQDEEFKKLLASVSKTLGIKTDVEEDQKAKVVKKEDVASNVKVMKKEDIPSEAKVITDKEVKEDKKICPVEALPEPIEVKDVKIIQKEDVPSNAKVISEPVEVKTVKENKIAMSDRRTCPVKVKTTKSSNKIHVGTKKIPNAKEDESLNHLINDLTNMSINFANVKRMPTRLVELDLIQFDGTPVKISVDVDNVLYGDDTRIFYIGRMNPMDEYSKPAFIFTFEAINSIVNKRYINKNLYVPEGFQILNRMVDFTTLRENDKTERDKVLQKTAKVIEKMNEEIIQNANGEPFRFAFAKYESDDKFTIVSSKRNRISNLAKNTLLTSKEIWIEVNGEDINLTCITK